MKDDDIYKVGIVIGKYHTYSMLFYAIKEHKIKYFFKKRIGNPINVN